MFFRKKRILIIGRISAKNFGDSVIVDTCKYIIEKCAAQDRKRVKVQAVDVYEKDREVWKKRLEGQDVVVYPGGGLNSVKFNQMLIRIFRVIKENPKTRIFINAIGLLENNINPKNENLLIRLFNFPLVDQVTTRGSYKMLEQYIEKKKKYPPKLVFDPAIWTDETYDVHRDESSEVIGIGVIRPAIFEANKNEFSEENVYAMYEGIISELDKRGYKWKLFTNGFEDDYVFAGELLDKLGLDREEYLGPKIMGNKELVEQIAGFKAVIAARLHANIISTSLRVPTVALVWNEKMHFFADIIGCPERYLPAEQLSDTKLIVDRMETAIAEGYNEERIEAMKAETIETIRNIYL
jgi:polysaccharide pyruvyl transferase WcaK-like protein